VRVLVLTQYYWPEAFRINEVVESLQGAGCSVTVLTGQPNYPDGKIYPGYRAWGCGREVHATGYSIYRVPIVPRGRASAWRLALNYLSFVASASTVGSRLLRRQRFDIIFVYGISPILQAIAAIALKRRTHAALVTWVQDLWPQSLQSAGFVSSQRLLGWVGAVVRWIYRRSDLLLVQSQAFVAAVTAMAGGTPVAYHPNPGEAAFAEAGPSGPPKLVLPPGFNVVFAGNLGTVQALDTVLEAAALLLPYEDIHLVLIGAGSRRDWLEREVARRGLSNVRLAGRFAPRDMPGILAQASALLVTLLRSPIMSQTIPSKMQAYLAAGRPAIAAHDGEGARVVTEAGAGVACGAEDAPALAQAVLSLRAAAPETLQRLGAAGRSYYQQHFEPSMLAQKLVQQFRAAAHPR
jgi:glycosyltransferase involved in cell wall biosynthesis